ncbi:MAG TPA: septal ring lytic transglycosylase RlpA family protein [Acetobacteraceae bacterium]|jgi:rare lipoprotein A|nr:septal ring lytic transglycosylase RlpA family protein [Acetobacteraceae bacterium]
MKLSRVLALWALLGCGWALPAEAADNGRRSAAAQKAASRPSQQAQAALRKGHRARAAAPHRERGVSTARLVPGRERIDYSGRQQRGRASYYGAQFKGRQMANGRPFNPNSNTAASRSLPLGTVARVKNPESGRETTVQVEDRGPYVPGRILDVAPRAADDLGMRQQGVAPVVIEPVAVPQPDGSVKPSAAATPAGVGQR